MTNEKQRCIYHIDSADIIRFVDSNWLDFARTNDAPELTRLAVEGRSIWDFISGKETQEIYRELFRRSREDHEITIPFRCDSPDKIRSMTLTMRLLPDDLIECEAILHKLECREPLKLFSRSTPRMQKSAPICSFCRKLPHTGIWVEAEEFVSRSRLFGTAEQPNLSESVCPDCRDRLN